MNNRNIIDERAAYTKRAQDYTDLIKKFSALELTNVGNYKILSEIGSGAFGKVYLGYHTLIRCKVCLKKGNRNISTPLGSMSSYSQLSEGNNSYVNNDNLMREFYYLREFKQHPHITKLYEIIFTETSVYMILEYYPSGDLFEYVTKKGHLSTNETLKIFTQLLGAVYYIHKSGCCHRDLKLENILLDKQMNVKLSDFGFTRELPFAQYGSKSLLSEYCGTGAYMAPELVQRKPYSGIKTDIWALGVIFYTMLTGEMPFDDSLDSKSLEYAIIHNKPRFLENLEILDMDSEDTLHQIKMLLNKMLSKDPENRITSLEEILRSPLFAPFDGEIQVNIVNKLHFNGSGGRDSWSDLSHSEKSLFKSLVNAGIDRAILKKSICEETLDSTYGLWSLLKDQKEKKSKRKSKRRSMLKLSSSRSIIGNARQAFSSSPIHSSHNDDHTYNGPMTHHLNPDILSRAGSIYTTAGSDAEGSLRRAGSLKTMRNLVLGGDKLENTQKLGSIIETSNKELTNINTEIDDKTSFVSKGSQNTSSNSKRKRHFSFLNIFKSKSSNDDKYKTLDNDSLLQKVITNSTSNTVFTNTKNSRKGSSSLFRDVKKSSISKDKDTAITPIKIEFLSASQDDVNMTPDQTRLKRSKPTRPQSVVSAYSAHTSVSETSNGSGYITGYSTDTNILTTMNTINNTSMNYNNSEQSQIIHSPQNSGRPKFSRGISEWSVNVSSQPESPNSSLAALSRSNSVDSSSRSVTSRKRVKNKNSNNITFLRRGRSPLNSKINTKWTLNDVNMIRKRSSLSRHDNRENQIIEEETTEGEDDGEYDDSRLAINDKFDQLRNNASFSLENSDSKKRTLSLSPSSSRSTVTKAKANGSSLSLSPLPHTYIQRKGIKFPILPVAEEVDQHHDAEDDADVEEDDNDYYDDIATEISDQEYKAQMPSDSQTNIIYNDGDLVDTENILIEEKNNLVKKIIDDDSMDTLGDGSILVDINHQIASLSVNMGNKCKKINSMVYSPIPKTPQVDQRDTITKLENSI